MVTRRSSPGRDHSGTLALEHLGTLAPGTLTLNITITPRGEERIRNGHPWIYRSDLVEVHAAGGDTVQVRSTRGRPRGNAQYSDR